MTDVPSHAIGQNITVPKWFFVAAGKLGNNRKIPSSNRLTEKPNELVLRFSVYFPFILNNGIQVVRLENSIVILNTL